MLNIEGLLNKENLTEEELDTILEDGDVTDVEECGMSGQYVGMNWTAFKYKGTEYNMYTKYSEDGELKEAFVK